MNISAAHARCCFINVSKWNAMTFSIMPALNNSEKTKTRSHPLLFFSNKLVDRDKQKRAVLDKAKERENNKQKRRGAGDAHPRCKVFLCTTAY